MQTGKQPENAAIHVREGTARSRTGKATAKKIIEAARDLLMQRGHSQFSMRNVAEQAGLHLANVQYYFPRRRDLVRALFVDTGERYQRAYDKILTNADEDPAQRYELVLRYSVKDILSQQTRQFFVQFWALLEETDNQSGRLLGELYAADIAQLGRLIAAMYPDEPADEIERRAYLVAALIEGLMVVRGSRTARNRGMKELIDDTVALGLRIANGVASQSPV